MVYDARSTQDIARWHTLHESQVPGLSRTPMLRNLEVCDPTCNKCEAEDYCTECTLTNICRPRCTLLLLLGAVGAESKTQSKWRCWGRCLLSESEARAPCTWPADISVKRPVQKASMPIAPEQWVWSSERWKVLKHIIKHTHNHTHIYIYNI